MARTISAANSSRSAVSMKQIGARFRISPLRRSRAPSIERCPPRHARARRGGPATVLLALPPRSRLPAPLSPPPGSRRGGLDLPRDPGLITPVRAGQTPPVDFCNHHGSQARPRNLTHSPCAPRKGIPRRGVLAGGLAFAVQAPAELSRFQGPAWSLRARQRLSVRSLAGELCPGPVGPDTSCHRIVPATGRMSWSRRYGTMSPRFRRRTTHEAPSVQGLALRSLPRRRSWTAHPRCLLYDGMARRPVRLSTGCYQPVDGSHDAFCPAANSSGV